MIDRQMQYKTETRTATLGGRQVRVEHLTPILSLKERDARKREIESRLYEVFVKYADGAGKQK